MEMQPKNNRLMATLATGLVVLLAGLMWVNNRLQKETERITDSSGSVTVQPVPARAVGSAPAPAQSLEGDVVRRAHVVRGGEYIEHVFYIGEAEVARFKESNERIFDIQGTIPDGRVTFVDDYKDTHGEEYYKYGKRQGAAKIYYADGRLKAEERYQLGLLMAKKEYYNSGQLRFEVDYEDARGLRDKKEVGIGKLYHTDGTLKFEWRIIKSESPGFKKSYNKDGSLRHAAYFDDQGKLIEEKVF